MHINRQQQAKTLTRENGSILTIATELTLLRGYQIVVQSIVIGEIRQAMAILED